MSGLPYTYWNPVYTQLILTNDSQACKAKVLKGPCFADCVQERVQEQGDVCSQESGPGDWTEWTSENHTKEKRNDRLGDAPLYWILALPCLRVRGDTL